MSGSRGRVKVTEPEESDESTDLDESTEWTKVNLQKLLAAMKTSYPEEYRHVAYLTGLKAVDWKKVAFTPFSPEACQNKWREILQKMRKMRSLAELIDEAEEVIANPVLNKKSHPECPKKPRPPTAIFYEEKRAKFKKQHPEMTSQQLFRLTTKSYQMLPEKGKARYVEKYHLEKEEHKRKMEVFRQQHPELDQQKKSTPHKRKRLSNGTPHQGEQPEDAAGLPPKPPCNGYSIFCQEQLPSMAGLSSHTYMSVWAERWKGLTKRQKDEYSIRHSKLQRKYMKRLNKYVKSFSKEEKLRILKEHGIKVATVNRESHVKKRHPGEPKMPSRSGNVIFCQDQMELMREKLPNTRERFRRVNQMWKELSHEEKLRYKKKVNEKLEKYSKKLKKWFETLTSEEQDDYWQHNPSKRKHLNPNKREWKRSEGKETMYRPSDSEDEEIEVSDCDEPENNLEEEEEEEEEDNKEDVVMFDIY